MEESADIISGFIERFVGGGNGGGGGVEGDADAAEADEDSGMGDTAEASFVIGNEMGVCGACNSGILDA